MIRPVTIATCLLACGSGLYLYQAKHRVQLLDRKIQDTVQAADKLRGNMDVRNSVAPPGARVVADEDLR